MFSPPPSFSYYDDNNNNNSNDNNDNNKRRNKRTTTISRYVCLAVWGLLLFVSFLSFSLSPRLLGGGGGEEEKDLAAKSKYHEAPPLVWYTSTDIQVYMPSSTLALYEAQKPSYI